MKVDKLAGSENFVQHLTSNLVKNPTFLVRIIYFVKQHDRGSITDEAKFYDEGLAPASEEEQSAPMSALTKMFRDFSNSSSNEEGKAKVKRSSFS